MIFWAGYHQGFYLTMEKDSTNMIKKMTRINNVMKRESRTALYCCFESFI